MAVTEQELVVLTLAGWKICSFCQRPHNPTDLLQTNSRPGELLVNCCYTCFYRKELESCSRILCCHTANELLK